MISQKNEIGRGWVKCSNCNYIIFAQEEAKHDQVCKAIIEDNLQFLSNSFNNEFSCHSFIKNSRFVGPCAENATEYLSGVIKQKGKNDDYFISLPSIVMKLCSIGVGSLVILSNSFGDQIIRTAVPYDHLRHDIGLSAKTCYRFNMKFGDYITVEPYFGSIFPADEIRLILKNNLTSISRLSSGLIGTLRVQECNKYITVGNLLSIRHIGNTFDFIVSTIFGKNEKISEPKSEGISSLKLKPNYFENIRFTTSTPVKSQYHLGAIAHQKQFYQITKNTIFKIENENHTSNKNQSLCYDKLGGLKKEISLIQKLVVESQRKNTTIGILISGPSGVGKSALIETVAAENQSHNFITINKPTEIYKNYSQVRLEFENAQIRSPSILLIENIDEWCPKRSDSVNIHHIHLASTLMIELNRIRSNECAVTIVATARDLNDLDPSLRRPFYFDFEIELGIPTVEQKFEILDVTLQPYKTKLNDSEIFDIAKAAHGYTGSTLKRLVEKAISEKLQVCEDVSIDIELKFNDLQYAMKDIFPDTLDGWHYQNTKVYWRDIGGYDHEKQLLIQAIEWPFINAEHFKRLGTSFSQGVLLYGPSGCGKSMLAEAIATETGFNFIYVTSNDVSIKFVGKSEEVVKNLFKAARRAAPCIVFFDKIECLASMRGGLGAGGRVESRVLGQLLNAVEKVRSEMVFVIGATTSPQLVDKALLRPGRFDRKIHVPIPNPTTRRNIFNILLRKLNISTDIIDDDLIMKTEKYSGADIKGLCRLALFKALQEQKSMTIEHLKIALNDVTSTVADHEIEICKRF